MNKYRDELIQTIKLMGQELIDRAESMVHDDCEMITNFNITIDIPQPMDGYPELIWSTSVVSKNCWEKETGHGAAEVKQEIHAESVAIETERKHGHWFVDYHPLTDTTFLKCSECKLVTTISPRAVIPDECPECGAKMEATDEQQTIS